MVMGKRTERGVGMSKAEAKAVKQQLFADLYVANGCIGAKAYLQAGYRAKNPHVAAVMANRLLRKPDIARLIRDRTQERLRAAKLQADEVIMSAARVLRFDPARLFNTKGKRLELHEMDEATRQALHIEIDGEGKVKYRSPDKNAAREQLMKHLGLFKEDNSQKPSVEVHAPGVRKVVFEPIPKTRKG